MQLYTLILVQGPDHGGEYLQVLCKLWVRFRGINEKIKRTPKSNLRTYTE